MSEERFATPRNGEWLKAMRAEAGMTVAAYRARLGVGRTALWRYENSKEDLPRWLVLLVLDSREPSGRVS